MSLKNRDEHNRWRNKTVAFRVSPEEDAQIEVAVKLTGLTKQDYIIRRLLCKDVVVQGRVTVIWGADNGSSFCHHPLCTFGDLFLHSYA